MTRRGEYIGKGHILGHVIAHEFGHLLLNLDSHSPTGIMRGMWDTNDFAAATYGDLLFTPQQAEVIRVDVARRVRQQQTAGVASLESLKLVR